MIRLAHSKPAICKKFIKTTTMKNLWTNHFNLDLNYKQQVYMMSLKVKPTVTTDMNHMLSRLIDASKKSLVQTLGSNYYLTGDVIYALQPLNDSAEEIKLATVEGYTLYITQTSETFTVGEVFTSECKTPEILRFLNVVLKTFMESRGFKEYGKHASYFNTNEKPVLLDKGISILPGFRITVDKYIDSSLKINIDTCFRISSADCIYYEYLNYVSEARGDKDSARSKFTFENIVGKSFSLQNDLNRMIKIHGVDPKKTLSSPSPVDGYKTMRDYLEDKFGTRLREKDQFICFNERKKKLPEAAVEASKKIQFGLERTYYPSELLYALGLKDYQKKDYRIMRQVAEITKMNPQNKMKAIIQCSTLFKSICNGSLDMKMAKNSQTPVQCTILNNPEYTIRDNKTMKAKDGIIFFKEKIFSNAELLNWAIIYECSDDYLEEFYDLLSESNKNLGVPMKDPLWIPMRRNPDMQDYKDAIDECKDEGAKIIMLIISKSTGENLYKKIKEYADLKAQVLTQCTIWNDKTLAKKGFFDKINFQICSKLGYPLWIVQKPQVLQKEVTMLIGADVYHNRGKESIAAVIATTNKDYSKYCSLSNVQSFRGKEIMDNIADMVMECVETFVATNKRFPKKILFYRDGVGDTMMDLVSKYEIVKIKEMLAEKYPENTPLLTFVVVTKRISVKSIDQEGSGQALNPKSGTIISSGITKKEMEFFMVAQNVTEGTATPTRYQVLLNECGYSSDTLHEITFFQAFNYYGWSGAVKVPAVCQYAHKLAYHVGENYRQSNKFMKQNLYYL
jgi:aubergine-like protein